MNRTTSSTDKLISKVDLILKAVAGGGRPDRESPAASLPSDDLTSREARLSARLMRVNHCGEVCAQALYLGQSVTSSQSRTRDVMRSAAIDEADHLAWCETRIAELASHRSYLNPFFFTMSFAAGAVSGLLGDKFNLGFVAATEEQVVKHLEEHIEKLPGTDHRSRAILEKMKEDEEQHRTTALKRGGLDLPGPLKRVMTGVSKVMTRTTYWV